MRRRPDIFLANGNGALNAFAAQATGHDYVVLSNELFVNLYQNNRDGLRFILGHEMGHIRLHHVALWYQIAVAYSERIPLLGPALSRLREYSCDGCGAYLAPNGSTGLVLARLGPVHRTDVDIDEMLRQGKALRGFWVGLARCRGRTPSRCAGWNGSTASAGSPVTIDPSPRSRRPSRSPRQADLGRAMVDAWNSTGRAGHQHRASPIGRKAACPPKRSATRSKLLCHRPGAIWRRWSRSGRCTTRRSSRRPSATAWSTGCSRAFTEVGPAGRARLRHPATAARPSAATRPGPPAPRRCCCTSTTTCSPRWTTRRGTTPVWQLTERDGRWYGRGAADCKGNIAMHLTALRALGSRLPVTVKIVGEGSEEQGTGGLEEFVPQNADLLRADAILVVRRRQLRGRRAEPHHHPARAGERRGHRAKRCRARCIRACSAVPPRTRLAA